MAPLIQRIKQQAVLDDERPIGQPFLVHIVESKGLQRNSELGAPAEIAALRTNGPVGIPVQVKTAARSARVPSTAALTGRTINADMFVWLNPGVANGATGPVHNSANTFSRIILKLPL